MCIRDRASVIRPGMYETQVAQWAYAVALELGVEQMGFQDVSYTHLDVYKRQAV